MLRVLGLASLSSPALHSIRRAKRNVSKYFGDNTTVETINTLIPVRLHLLKMHPVVY